jgi:hypothetical protein
MTGNDILRSQTRTPLGGQGRSSLSARRAARELLLLCTTSNISSENKERILQILAGTVDWKYLFDLAELHGTASLIAHNLMAKDLAGQVSRPCLDKLNQIYNSNLYRNMVISGEQSQILSVFSQRGIANIPLKGTILAEVLFENLALRRVTDIDILINHSDMVQAGSLLEGMGYRQLEMQGTWDHPFHDVPYYKKKKFPLFVELHWDLADRKLMAVAEQEIWRRAQPMQLQGITTKVLSPEDNLLYLAHHLSKQETYLLKFLADIAELLKKYGGVLDWDYIIESARSWQIEYAVYFSLRRVKDLLAVPVADSVLGALKPAWWRWAAIDLLIPREAFVSPIRGTKLRGETLALGRSLMMKRIPQILAVLSRHRGSDKRVAWLRTATWAVLVFGAALGRSTVRAVPGWK